MNDMPARSYNIVERILRFQLYDDYWDAGFNANNLIIDKLSTRIIIMTLEWIYKIVHILIIIILRSHGSKDYSINLSSFMNDQINESTNLENIPSLFAYNIIASNLRWEISFYNLLASNEQMIEWKNEWMNLCIDCTVDWMSPKMRIPLIEEFASRNFERCK